MVTRTIHGVVLGIILLLFMAAGGDQVNGPEPSADAARRLVGCWYEQCLDDAGVAVVLELPENQCGGWYVVTGRRALQWTDRVYGTRDSWLVSRSGMATIVGVSPSYFSEIEILGAAIDYHLRWSCRTFPSRQEIESLVFTLAMEGCGLPDVKGCSWRWLEKEDDLPEAADREVRKSFRRLLRRRADARAFGEAERRCIAYDWLDSRGKAFRHVLVCRDFIFRGEHLLATWTVWRRYVPSGAKHSWEKPVG